MNDVGELSDADLLGAVIGSRPAAARLLGDAKNLATIARLEPGSIADTCGLSPGKARQIALALELARRTAREEQLGRGLVVRGPVDTHALMGPRLAHLDHEELWLVALDGNNGLRGLRQVARGGACGLSVAQEDVLRVALLCGARGFVLVHNHPSNDPTPSKVDIAFTEKVAVGAAFVGVKLLDHVVVARRGFAQVPFG